MAEIKDSGDRTQYSTGAVRDCKEGKGRCDLMPLDVLGELLESPFLMHIEAARASTKDCAMELTKAAKEFANEWYYLKDEKAAMPNLLLQVAIHFEDGANKYGPNNWQKGIPVHSYIDSAARHYLKYRGGWTDERHDRAAMWNVLCALWTINHKPELNDYANQEVKKSENDDVTYLRLAFEVLEKKWGNGTDRVKALTDAGYDYNRVQGIVNYICAMWMKKCTGGNDNG